MWDGGLGRAWFSPLAARSPGTGDGMGALPVGLPAVGMDDGEAACISVRQAVGQVICCQAASWRRSRQMECGSMAWMDRVPRPSDQDDADGDDDDVGDGLDGCGDGACAGAGA